jgi:hypothetical protein
LNRQGAKGNPIDPQITQISQIDLNVTAFGGRKPRSEEILNLRNLRNLRIKLFGFNFAPWRLDGSLSYIKRSAGP